MAGPGSIRTAHGGTCGHVCESDACVDGACTVRPCADIGSTANPVCFVDSGNREIYGACGAQVSGVATPTCTSHADGADACRLCSNDDVTGLGTVGYAVDPFGYVTVETAARRRPAHAQGGAVSAEEDVTTPRILPREPCRAPIEQVCCNVVDGDLGHMVGAGVARASWRTLMDGTQFDRLARAFARVGTRRQVVAGAAVVAVGAGGLEAAGAATRCRAGRQTCQRDNQCCSGSCQRGREIPLKDRNRCACGEGETRCGNACVDLQHDERNCGACGTRCRTGDLCCPDGCIDAKTDEENCGACGNRCDTGEVCCGGTCAALDSDADNCGACGHACGEGGGCVGGYCDFPEVCPAAWQGDTWYCVASTEGKAFIDGDEASLTKLADWGSDAADCQSSSDCDRFPICRDGGVECACVTGDYWEQDVIDRWAAPSCVADIKQWLCSDPDTTAGFDFCYENVERTVWGAFIADSRYDSNWVCQSSDQCNGDWDPLCDDPHFGCGCVYAQASTAGDPGILGMTPTCVRRRVHQPVP